MEQYDPHAYVQQLFETYRKKRKKHLIMRIALLILLIVCIILFLLGFMSFDLMFGIEIGIILVIWIYRKSIQVWSQKFYQVLDVKCEPEAYIELFQKLVTLLPKKSAKQFFKIQIAKGFFYCGEPEKTCQQLSEIDYQSLAFFPRMHYLVLEMRCGLALDDPSIQKQAEKRYNYLKQVEAKKVQRSGETMNLLILKSHGEEAHYLHALDAHLKGKLGQVPRVRAECYAEKARLLFQSGQLEEAKYCYWQAREIGPKLFCVRELSAQFHQEKEAPQV
ncbi:hypothetical protein [Listeria costaricensis]|uniref:hypothetical protein n=1 Tax=Listeria costaricensis TaxID=2026604 RepID=UPI000C08CF7A|nr:hypothetical protein [Listeria costaricensis]